MHFFALSVTTSLKIPGAVIPRRVFTRPGPFASFGAVQNFSRFRSEADVTTASLIQTQRSARPSRALPSLADRNALAVSGRKRWRVVRTGRGVPSCGVLFGSGGLEERSHAGLQQKMIAGARGEQRPRQLFGTGSVMSRAAPHSPNSPDLPRLAERPRAPRCTSVAAPSAYFGELISADAAVGLVCRAAGEQPTDCRRCCGH